MGSEAVGRGSWWATTGVVSWRCGGAQYRILRKKGTEPPGTGEFNKNKEEGVYNCGGCGTPLYK